MMNSIKDGNDNWTVVVGNKAHQFDKANPNYVELVDAVRNDDEAGFLRIIEIGHNIQNWSEGNFRFTDGVLTYGDEEIHSVITDRIIDLIRNKFSFKNMLNFLERLYKNPSYRAIHQLYTFMVHKHLPITPDGYILMYKAITPDWKDKWTQKLDYRIGQKPSMPRHQVEDNPDCPCGPGLHAGSIEFVKGYGSKGDRTIIVKVDPADVVSIPKDSDCQKVRTCGFEIVAEYAEDLLGPVNRDYSSENHENDQNLVDNGPSSGYNDSGDDDEDEFDDEDLDDEADDDELDEDSDRPLS